MTTIHSTDLDKVTGGGIVQTVKDAANNASNWAFGSPMFQNQGSGKQVNHNKTVNNYNGCPPPSGG